MRDVCGIDDSKFGVNFSVAQATWQKIVLSRFNRVKDKRDGAKECSVAKATEHFHMIFQSECVSYGCSGALDDHYNAPEERYNARKCSVAQASYNFSALEQLSLRQFRFGAPPSIAILAMADETRAHMRAFESPESWEHSCLPIPKPISPALELARNSQGLSNPS